MSESIDCELIRLVAEKAKLKMQLAVARADALRMANKLCDIEDRCMCELTERQCDSVLNVEDHEEANEIIAKYEEKP